MVVHFVDISNIIDSVHDCLHFLFITKVVSSNPTRPGVLDTTLCDKVSQ